MLLSLYVHVTCNPFRAVTLPNIRVPQHMMAQVRAMERHVEHPAEYFAPEKYKVEDAERRQKQEPDPL